jgi:hypothetical protein
MSLARQASTRLSRSALTSDAALASDCVGAIVSLHFMNQAETLTW